MLFFCQFHLASSPLYIFVSVQQELAGSNQQEAATSKCAKNNEVNNHLNSDTGQDTSYQLMKLLHAFSKPLENLKMRMRTIFRTKKSDGPVGTVDETTESHCLSSLAKECTRMVSKTPKSLEEWLRQSVEIQSKDSSPPIKCDR